MKYIIQILAVMASLSSGDMIVGQVETSSNIWRMNYTIDTTTSMFHATVRCQTAGWIGMGLSYKGASGHAMTDSMVAFMANGTHHIYDQYSNDHSQPMLDTALGGKEDLTITGWRQGNGTHSVTFMRALNTNDGDRDIVIQNKDVYVAWACGNDIPEMKPDGNITYNMHPDNQFGATQVNLFSNPMSSTTSPLQSGQHGMMTSSSPSGGMTTATKSAADSVSSWFPFAVAAIVALSALF